MARNGAGTVHVMKHDAASNPMAEAAAAFKAMNDRVVAGLQPAVEATERMRDALRLLQPPVLEIESREDSEDLEGLLNEISDQSADHDTHPQILEKLDALLASLSEMYERGSAVEQQPPGRTSRGSAGEGWIWTADAIKEFGLPASTLHDWKEALKKEDRSAVAKDPDTGQVRIRRKDLEALHRRRRPLTN